jgi:hypothetical protein
LMHQQYWTIYRFQQAVVANPPSCFVFSRSNAELSGISVN